MNLVFGKDYGNGWKNHKLVVNTKCKDTCCCHSSCLLVYNEKNESTDDSGSDIEVSPTGIIKVK